MTKIDDFYSIELLFGEDDMTMSLQNVKKWN